MCRLARTLDSTPGAFSPQFEHFSMTTVQRAENPRRGGPFTQTLDKKAHFVEKVTHGPAPLKSTVLFKRCGRGYLLPRLSNGNDFKLAIIRARKDFSDNVPSCRSCIAPITDSATACRFHSMR